LVALCRALIKDRKVLVLDEATSSVDPETDTAIQRTIRNEFKNVTLSVVPEAFSRRTLILPFSLCIAHRLATIAFYDRILVLEQGSIAEFDTPLNLYDREGSVFRGMCEAAGLSRGEIMRIRGEE
jgi:ATP-binding cassette subfamily C (CFTR/MRP) protein 1